jgi:hypothetical protein
MHTREAGPKLRDQLQWATGRDDRRHGEMRREREIPDRIAGHESVRQELAPAGKIARDDRQPIEDHDIHDEQPLAERGDQEPKPSRGIEQRQAADNDVTQAWRPRHSGARCDAHPRD